MERLHRQGSGQPSIYANIGSGGTTEVTPVYLMGAQALAIAYAKRWRSRTEMFDYGDKYGVAIDGIYGVSKVRFGTGASDTTDLKDHGLRHRLLCHDRHGHRRICG